jgi:hypothetical protein
MKRLSISLAVAAVMLSAAFIPAQPVEAKSIGQMLESAVNSIRRQNNPYGYNQYGYGTTNPYGYGTNPYYGNPYGYNPYANNAYSNQYGYGYNPYGYQQQSSSRNIFGRLLNGLF